MNTFAGFTLPRTLRISHGTLAQRLDLFRNLKTKGYANGRCTGPYRFDMRPTHETMGFYLESDFAPGLRWDWAHEVPGASITHTGWFCDRDSHQTAQGIVLRLPKGRGFLAGYTLGEGMSSELLRTQTFDCPIAAGYCADSMAENVAEASLENNSTDHDEAA
ncbi:hypothetical protein [Ferrimonas marina]|uniref:Uncharacterized protein n=1 Tax=Ferrimonas marina TaxID=299255 RepID=A0A1M5U952_9GAMM|nr:hypothetical protein [Ferrimonas marina]SHH59203.1 hypothetical protein SAMN02745129_2450 [Ferrimonas marina]